MANTQTITPPPQTLSRFELIWMSLWGLTFIIGTVGSMANASSQDAFEILVLSITLAITQAIVFRLRQMGQNLQAQPNLSLTLFFIQVILWVTLVLSSPFWLIHLFSMVVQLHQHLVRRFALGLDLLMFLGALFQQIEVFGFTLLNLSVWVILSVMGYVFGLWMYNIINDSAERLRLLEELQATQAELIAAEHREGVLAERGRLARDIHDTLAQGYIGVIMHLEAADEMKKTQPEKAEFHFQQAEKMARVGLTQARQVVNDLRPDLLEKTESPAEALQALLADWSTQSGIETSFSENGDPADTHPETEITMLRTTQEGLANIMKHAQATAVQVTLSWIGEQVVLDIEDNGVGFDHDPEENSSDPFAMSGFGLHAMNERVSQSGGELFVESAVGEGTTVTAILPLSQTAKDNSDGK